MKKTSLIFLLLLAACASPGPKKANTSVVKTPQTARGEQKIKITEESQQDLRDHQRILEQKTRLTVRAVPQKQTLSTSVPTVLSASASKLSDRDLYAELVGCYDRNSELAFFSRLPAFDGKYAKSPLADDAFYLAGLMSLAKKNYGPALEYFNKVVVKYPTSNKAGPALFAKGVVLKKMNLETQAKSVFEKVKRTYPGSPEVARAETELKLIK